MKNTKLVWTSDPDKAKRLRESGKAELAGDASPSGQTIRVVLDRKRRAGKTVTVASGFELTADTLSRLATALKKRCGAGGSVKDGEIEVQGDHVSLVGEELRGLGYRVK